MLLWRASNVSSHKLTEFMSLLGVYVEDITCFALYCGTYADVVSNLFVTSAVGLKTPSESFRAVGRVDLPAALIFRGTVFFIKRGMCSLFWRAFRVPVCVLGLIMCYTVTKQQTAERLEFWGGDVNVHYASQEALFMLNWRLMYLLVIYFCCA